MKKIACLFLSFLLVFGLSLPVLAEQNPSVIHGLKKNHEIVQLIASGSDYLVGANLPASGEITPQWASGGIDHTHQFLTAQALEILYADKSSKVASLLTLYASDLLTGSDWPDTSENDSGLYISHFYDPYTGRTFIAGWTTALNRFTTHANNAKKYYAKNKSLAMQELGRALHYLADINEPHHAALMGITTNHAAYENWVDIYRTDFKVTSSTMYTSINIDAKRYYTAYCTALFQSAAKNAYTWADAVSASDSYPSDVWRASAADTLSYAQQSMAAFLYNFLYSVGAIRLTK